MRRKPLPPIFYIIVIPICITLALYGIYIEFYIYGKKQGSHYIVNLVMVIGGILNLTVVYIWYLVWYNKERKGYKREKVYITRCPHCGYEFKYGVGKYCPQCHRRIWRPYKWVWVKKEEGEGENLKISGGDR